MNDYLKKVRIVFLPLFIIAVTFVVTYTFLNWLIFIKLELFSIKEIYVEFGLPFVLPWIPVLIWLRPKLKVLEFKKKNNDPHFAYQFIATLIIVIPTIIAQKYIVTATGNLTQIETINEIVNQPKSKYYKISEYYIDKDNIGVKNVFEVSGKNNRDFNMNIYISMPIYKSKNNTNSIPYAWFGKKYHKRINNRIEPDEKEREFKKFAKESQNEFNVYNPNEFVYLDRISNSDDKDGYFDAMKKSDVYDGNYSIILVPKNEPFENRNGNKIFWIIGTLSIGLIFWLIMLILPKINKKEFNRIESGKPFKDVDLDEFIDFLKPQDGFFITPIIIYMNFLVFMIMFFSGLGFMSFQGENLLVWGANFKPLTANGEWWRLLSNIFLHGGFAHLFFNMYGLLFVGIFLEPILGRTKYLFVYLISGIVASLASIWWYDATISIGASGAIFGLYGLFLAFMATKIFHPEFSKAFLWSTLVFVGINLLMGIAGGIDNAAHIGGLVAGLIIGLILTPILKNNEAIE